MSVTAWPGFKVTGNVTPEAVNPAPVSAAEAIVTGEVPVEVRVTGCVEAVFNVTLPNVRLAALSVNCGLSMGGVGGVGGVGGGGVGGVGGVGAAVPVPLRFTTAVPLGTELL